MEFGVPCATLCDRLARLQVIKLMFGLTKKDAEAP